MVVRQELIDNCASNELGSAKNKDIHICSMELRVARLSEFPATRFFTSGSKI